MGSSFTFKWQHPAEDVYVTGTFDDWTKSEKLEKKGNLFEKRVELEDASEKIYYKFVVDGNWCTDPTVPQETDYEGNLNNVLMPEQIAKHTAAEAIMSNVTPESTTAALAGEVPLENKAAEDLPGAFPVTPQSDPSSFSVNPIPASGTLGNPIELAPGEPVPDPSTFASNTVSSTVHDDLTLAGATDYSQEKVSVKPIPATGGGGNPITLAPGEKVPEPSEITSNTLSSTVRTDKESYENSDALGGLPVVPPTIPESEGAEEDPSLLDLPPISKNMIPESSLPIGTGGTGTADGIGTFDAGPFIQSVGPQSTTAQLAGQVPLENQPATSEDASPLVQSVGPQSTTSQLAGQAPLETQPATSEDASPLVQTVGPQSTTTQLAEQVPLEPEQPTTSDDVSPLVQTVGPQSTTAQLAGQVAVETQPSTSDDVSPLMQSVGPQSTTAQLAGQVPLETQPTTSDDISPLVQSVGPQSTTTHLAGQVPVISDDDKKGDTGTDVAPDTTDVPEAPLESGDVTATIRSADKDEVVETEESNANGAIAPAVPEPAKEQIIRLGESAEAAKSSKPEEEEIVKKELSSEVAPEGEPASKSTDAAADSRDISPTTVPGGRVQPVAGDATGVTSISTEKTSTAPDTPTTPATSAAPSTGMGADGQSTTNTAATDKRKKRFSFLTKLKDKLTDRSKDKN